ncbi:MAG: hypothetical protein JWM68_547 [Verrucomicrobiales bacterium]|nr:hypothetical protein [Verrucomicrobiales bacterium]
MKKWIKGLVAAVIILGIGWYFERRPSPLDLPEEIRLILSAPDSVKASRTLGFMADSAADSPKALQAFYEKETNSVVVPRGAAERVAAIITLEDRKSATRSKCIYRPGFVMTFIRSGEKSIDIFFCFECGGMVMKISGQTDPQDLGMMTTYQAELLAIFKKLFPEDPKIRAL